LSSVAERQNITALWHSVCYLTTSQEIGWEEHIRNDLFYVEWDVKF